MTIKTKIYLSFLIFLILNFGLIFLSRNLFLEIKKASSEIFSEKEELFLLSEKAKGSENFIEFLRKENENLKKLEGSFINQEMPLEFFSFLEKMAGDYNLSLKISSLSLPKAEKDPWPSIGFRLEILGSFPNFSRFLERLESSAYLIQFLNLNVSRIEKPELLEGKEFPIGQIRADLSIKVFTK